MNDCALGLRLGRHFASKYRNERYASRLIHTDKCMYATKVTKMALLGPCTVYDKIKLQEKEPRIQWSKKNPAEYYSSYYNKLL